MRQLLAATTALALSTCCFKCSPEQKSYVDVPAKLDEVKKLAKPPEVVVEVVRQTKASGGGGGCGHSAACVILLPLIVWQSAFPEKFDEVTVTDHGEQTFHGLYSTSGDLLSARVKTPEGWRELAQLDLPELGQRAIVERAKVTVGSDGNETSTPTTIDSQLSVATQYGEALKKAKPKKRGALLLEAYQALDGEGDAFALAQLASKGEPEESRLVVMHRICDSNVEVTRQAKVLTAAMTTPTRALALEALGCEATPDAVAVRGVRLLSEGLCSTARAREPFELSRGLTPAGQAEALRVAATCSPVDAALIKLSFNLEMPNETYLAALDDPKGGQTVLQFTKPEQHGYLFAELARRKHTAEIFERLSQSRTHFTGPEANVIIDVALEQKRDAKGWELRSLAAKMLRNAFYVRDEIRPRLTALKPPDARTGQAFLTVLEDADARTALANGLDPKKVQLAGLTPDTEDEFVLFALVEAGCSRSALLEGKKAAACSR